MTIWLGNLTKRTVILWTRFLILASHIRISKVKSKVKKVNIDYLEALHFSDYPGACGCSWREPKSSKEVAIFFTLRHRWHTSRLCPKVTRKSDQIAHKSHYIIISIDKDDNQSVRNNVPMMMNRRLHTTRFQTSLQTFETNLYIFSFFFCLNFGRVFDQRALSSKLAGELTKSCAFPFVVQPIKTTLSKTRFI